MSPASFTVPSAYSCFFAYAIIYYMIGFLFMLLACTVIWSPLTRAWFQGGYWWLFIFTPVASLCLVIATSCWMLSNSNRQTKKRNMELYSALQRANDLFLTGTGFRLEGGDYAAWIELIYDQN